MTIYTEKYQNLTIKIEQDEDSMSPREWDNLGKITTWHNRYLLGDEQQKIGPEWLECLLNDYEYDHEFTDRKIILERLQKYIIIMPVYLYDHSGISLSTSPFSCSWDSGQVGFIHVSIDQIKKEYGWKNLTQKRREKIQGYLENEIKTYSDYVEGNVYGYEIYDGDLFLDSCWGYIGDYDGEYGALKEAREAVKGIIKYKNKERFKRLKTLIKNNVPLSIRQKELSPCFI